MKIRKLSTLTTILLLIIGLATAQQPEADNLTREDVMSMSVEELSDLPLEELMSIMDVMGVSTMDELFNMIMNKEIGRASCRERV